MNPTLKSIHSMLIGQVSALSAKLDETTDPDVAQKITMEMQEVVHRVNLVQSLLFAEASNDLDKKLAPIQDADSKLTASIDSMKSIRGVIDAAGKFLSFVDQAIDLAKKIS